MLERPGHRFAITFELSWSGINLSVPKDKDDIKKHVKILGIKPLHVHEFESELRNYIREIDSAEGATKRQVLVFIHGFNVRFDDALRQTAQLAFDLDFSGAPILYSWPSAGELIEYGRDLPIAFYSEDLLLELLNIVRTKIDAQTVHIIAHSMGNQVLVNALRHIDRSPLEVSAAHLRQIVFAAPDIDARSFPMLAEAFKGKADRFTVYASTKDVALLGSEIVSSTRVGNSVCPNKAIRHIDTIDVTEVCPNLEKDPIGLCHDLFASSPVLADLNRLILYDDSPDKRRLQRVEPSRCGMYWQMRKD
jgi:esterase/lipase superfamily enzyme